MRLLLPGLLLLMGCEGPTGTGDGDGRFDGTWRYEAVIAGSPSQVIGELRLSGAASGAVEGTLSAELIEVTLVGGQLRTHLSQLRGDSLVGDWVQGGTTPASGTFRASRVR